MRQSEAMQAYVPVASNQRGKPAERVGPKTHDREGTIEITRDHHSRIRHLRPAMNREGRVKGSHGKSISGFSEIML
jgi:hypothetical protein